MNKTLDLAGKKFGLLTVKEFAGVNKKHAYSEWLCECECGNTKVMRGNYLTTGLSKSCGCLRKRVSAERTSKVMTTHGCSKTRIYRTYTNIKRNCYSKRNYNYKFFGARGITVCDEWKDDFMAFYEWAMKTGYTDEKFLIRKDKKGNYEPSNCYFSEEVTR